MFRWVTCFTLALTVACFLGGAVPALGQVALFEKFCGRVPLPALRSDDPNPADLSDAEECGDGEDNDGDGTVDYEDLDCQGGLGTQEIFLKTPFDVIQPIGEFAAARFTGTDRNVDGRGEILINSTGDGGRKLSYLRTTGRDIYTDVSVRVLVLPGSRGDEGGPVALRIQPADAGENAGMSYYAHVVPGDFISIRKQLANGDTEELAGLGSWESGDAVEVVEGADVSTCYEVRFTAVGSTLTLTVSEVACDVVRSWTDSLSPLQGHTLTIEATDDQLAQGYIGLRSDNDLGGDVDDVTSTFDDPSVLDFVVSDPNEVVDPDAPRIAFFNSFSGNTDELDYTTSPITPTNNVPYNRSGSAVADTSLAAYLRALGFHVDEFAIDSFSSLLIAPEDINSQYDLFWLPSSGGSNSTLTFVSAITIPMVFSEHASGQPRSHMIYAGNSGNETLTDCGDGTSLSTTSLRVLSEELGGDPDHPIVRGLADEEGNITVHDAAGIPLNVAYPLPGDIAGLSGEPFQGIQERLEDRGIGPGAPQTQFGGYPVTEGAVILGALNNPCTGEPFFQLDGDGNLATSDGNGHTHLIAVEEGSPRFTDNPELCPGGCEFEARTVFYWLSDPTFPYATTETLALLRRAALWSLGLLESPNRSDVPFRRGDSNSDGMVDASDAITTFEHLFLGGGALGCADAADANDDELLDLSDGIATLTFLFLGGEPPRPPFALCFQGCGLDFTPAPSDAEQENPASILGCESFSACR